MTYASRCGEDCRLCRQGLPHPPVLVAYDKEERGYKVPDDPVCTARWASSGRGHAEGTLCGAPGTEAIGDVDLCMYHYQRALGWLWKRYAEAPLEWEKKRQEAERYARETRSIVYYLFSEASGLIKIGYSSGYRARLSKLQGEHGKLRLLLAAPGGRKEEDEAHRAFAEHCERGEWFRPGKSLLLYIQRARRASEGRATLMPAQVPIAEIRALIRERRQAGWDQPLGSALAS